MFRESGSGQDVSNVRGENHRKKQISLTARDTSSLVIDSLRGWEKAKYQAVTWLYCDYNTEDEQTVHNMIGAILKPLVSREVLEDIRKVADWEARLPQLPDPMQILRAMIASLPRVFICIDALDECPQKNLPELLASLRSIVQEFPRTRIFLTGRPHVKEVVQKYFTQAVAILICPNPSDIRNYLEMRLDSDDKPGAMDNDLRVDIGEVVVAKMSDRWAGAFDVFPCIKGVKVYTY